MQAVTTADLLAYWESNINRPGIQRGIALLCLAYPGLNYQEAASLTIGERDSRLFQIREWMFGRNIRNMADCPRCNCRVEWESDLQDITRQLSESTYSTGTCQLETDDYSLQFRLPDSNDIAAAISTKNKSNEIMHLLEKIVLECRFRGQPCEIENLTEEIIEMTGTKIAEADPFFDITMNLSCTECSHQWNIPFDILSYIWIEINNWALHIFQEVALLARTFGWSEREIISMTPARRQVYLSLLNS